jgi:hypothetical protein
MTTTSMETTTEAAPVDRPARPNNQFFVRCPLERESLLVGDGNVQGLVYTATGEIKPQFQWIQDDDVVCTEHVFGLRLCINMVDGIPVQVRTRKTTVNLFDHGPIFSAVKEAFRLGSLPRNGECFGVIPGDPHILMNSKDEGLYTAFLPYQILQQRAKLSQWHNGPKSADSMSKWLYEDLSTKLSMGRYDPIVTTRVASFRNDGNRRPDGLTFFKPTETEDGEKFFKMATVQNSCFPWWWTEREERIFKELKKQRSSVLTELKNDVQRATHELKWD